MRAATKQHLLSNVKYIECSPFHFHSWLRRNSKVANQLPRTIGKMQVCVSARARYCAPSDLDTLPAAIKWSKLFTFISVVGVRRVNPFNHLLFYLRIFAFNEVIVTGHRSHTAHTRHTMDLIALAREQNESKSKPKVNCQLKSHVRERVLFTWYFKRALVAFFWWASHKKNAEYTVYTDTRSRCVFCCREEKEMEWINWNDCKMILGHFLIGICIVKITF